MAECLRMRVGYSLGTIVGPAVSTLHFLTTGSDVADVTAAQSKLRNLFTALKPSFCQVLYTFFGTGDFIDLASGALLRSASIADATDSGSASGEALPAANQVNLRFETNIILNSRRLRGHWYMPGAAELASNGNLSGAIFANLAGAKAAFLAGTVVPLVYHRPVGHLGSIRPGQGYSVTDVVAQPKFAILRSRRD